MSNVKNESLYNKQKNVKPKIDDVVGGILEGDVLNCAQDFISFIKEHKMNPSWASANSWKISYKNKGVCYIRLHGAAEYYNMEAGSWSVNVHVQYDKKLQKLISGESDEIKTLVKNHVDNNVPCGGCMPGLDRRSVNKDFSNIAACTSIHMQNPDSEMIAFAKKLVLIRRESIAENKIPKCRYIKPADRT